MVSPFPFATESYVTEWATALRQLQQLHPTALVPGHGAVMHDTQYLGKVADVLESIAAQARKRYTPGMTSDSLAAVVDVSPLADRFAHGDAFLQANFMAQMHLAVERMWQELSGQWMAEGGTLAVGRTSPAHARSERRCLSTS